MILACPSRNWSKPKAVLRVERMEESTALTLLETKNRLVIITCKEYVILLSISWLVPRLYEEQAWTKEDNAALEALTAFPELTEHFLG